MGAGSHLTAILEGWHTPCGSCGALAKRMDERGVEWCRRRADSIVDHMLRKSGVGWVPFSRRVAHRLLDMAIARAMAD